MCLVIRNFGGCRMKLCSLKRRSPKCVSAVFDGADLNRRCDWRRRVVFAEMKVAEMCAPNSTDTRQSPTFTVCILCLVPNRLCVYLQQSIEPWPTSSVTAMQPSEVTLRQTLTIFTNISTGEIHLDTNVTTAEYIFHQ